MKEKLKTKLAFHSKFCFTICGEDGKKKFFCKNLIKEKIIFTKFFE